MAADGVTVLASEVRGVLYSANVIVEGLDGRKYHAREWIPGPEQLRLVAPVLPKHGQKETLRLTSPDSPAPSA